MAANSGQKTRGFLRSPSWLASRILSLLLEHYGTTQLPREVLDLASRHGSKLLGISSLYGYPVGLGRPGLPFPIRNGATWPADPPWDSLFWLDDAGWSELNRIRKFKEYRREIQALARRWGLCAAWGPVAVHSLTVGAGTRLVLGAKPAPIGELPGMEAWLDVMARSWPSVPVSLVTASAARGLEGMTWDVSTKWEPVEQAIVAQLRSVRDSIRASAKGSRLVTLEDTRPNLERHVLWLFLRICPQDDVGRPWGWKKIAVAEKVSLTTVRNAVLALSHEVGITPPDLRAGRPAEFR